MKFATQDDGSTFGRLYIVSRDLSRCAPAEVAVSLQDALERWDEVAPALAVEYDAVNSASSAVTTFDPHSACAPMPRALQWLDGSAFGSHGALMAKVFGIDDPASPDRPLMYQGVSDCFIGPYADAALPSEDDGIDFEGEFAVITDAVSMGVTPAEALERVRLLVLVNDWSLRRLAPIEMKTGFGWIQAKPVCGMGPVAVTPDELGAHWHDGRVTLPLEVYWNNARFGAPVGTEMSFGFGQLISYAAYSRVLPAGTVLGSGTVSNASYREVGSTCIAERRGIEMLDHGEATTGFMRFGDRVRMEVRDPDDGTSVFGTLDQRVVAATR